MKNIRRIVEYIGFAMFLIGGAGMDNENLVLPISMVLIGLAIICISAKREYSHTDR